MGVDLPMSDGLPPRSCGLRRESTTAPAVNSAIRTPMADVIGNPSRYGFTSIQHFKMEDFTAAPAVKREAEEDWGR
jgi:hypothetical protein